MIPRPSCQNCSFEVWCIDVLVRRLYSGNISKDVLRCIISVVTWGHRVFRVSQHTPSPRQPSQSWLAPTCILAAAQLSALSLKAIISAASLENWMALFLAVPVMPHLVRTLLNECLANHLQLTSMGSPSPGYDGRRRQKSAHKMFDQVILRCRVLSHLVPAARVPLPSSSSSWRRGVYLFPGPWVRPITKQ